MALIMCDMGRMRAAAIATATAIAAGSCVLVAACSSGQHSAVAGPASASASVSSSSSSPSSSSSGSGDAVQAYLDAVNTLCDGLEQKIVALNGGQFDIPLKDFLAQLPQHTKLGADFDRQLAAITVPGAATAKAQALAAYITFADKLDAARLRAARQGAAAYQREIDAEKKTAASDPSITALDAAGFNESCQAR